MKSYAILCSVVQGPLGAPGMPGPAGKPGKSGDTGVPVRKLLVFMIAAGYADTQQRDACKRS